MNNSQIWLIDHFKSVFKQLLTIISDYKRLGDGNSPKIIAVQIEEHATEMLKKYCWQ